MLLQRHVNVHDTIASCKIQLQNSSLDGALFFGCIFVNNVVGRFRPRLIELINIKPKLLIRFIMNKSC